MMHRLFSILSHSGWHQICRQQRNSIAPCRRAETLNHVRFDLCLRYVLDPQIMLARHRIGELPHRTPTREKADRVARIGGRCLQRCSHQHPKHRLHTTPSFRGSLLLARLSNGFLPLTPFPVLRLRRPVPTFALQGVSLRERAKETTWC